MNLRDAFEPEDITLGQWHAVRWSLAWGAVAVPAAMLAAIIAIGVLP